jgi:L-threonylcarbamoyladenylate synthase
VHLARAEQLCEFAVDLPDVAQVLANTFWPGPLSIVVRKNASLVSDAATGGRETVALRVPDHPLALALLDAFGRGIAAPSANRFGKVSPTTAAHVVADLGTDVDVVLDGGPCRVGVESTIVDVTGVAAVILRVGGVTEHQLRQILGQPLARRTTGEIAAPGTLESHYAPNARIELVAASDVQTRVDELRAEGVRAGALEAPADADEYARVLYAKLREADQHDLDVVVAPAPTEDDGISAAIADRLRRARGR